MTLKIPALSSKYGLEGILCEKRNILLVWGVEQYYQLEQ